MSHDTKSIFEVFRFCQILKHYLTKESENLSLSNQRLRQAEKACFFTKRSEKINLHFIPSKIKWNGIVGFFTRHVAHNIFPLCHLFTSFDFNYTLCPCNANLYFKAYFDTYLLQFFEVGSKIMVTLHIILYPCVPKNALHQWSLNVHLLVGITSLYMTYKLNRLQKVHKTVCKRAKQEKGQNLFHLDLYLSLARYIRSTNFRRPMHHDQRKT